MKYYISLAILLFTTSLFARENFQASKHENSDRAPTTVSSVNSNLPTLYIGGMDTETEGSTKKETGTPSETKKTEKPVGHSTQ